MTGEPATVTGIVTLVSAGQGVFIQSRDDDGDPATSEGLYLDSAILADDVSVGDLVAASGTIAELGESDDTLTALTGIGAFRICASHQPLTTEQFGLPLDEDELESLEAMNLEWSEPLHITDTYRLAQGDIRLSSGTILPIPTEVARPGNDARRQLAQNRSASVYARLAPGSAAVLPAGASLLSGSAVLGHDGQGLRLMLRDDLNVLEPTLYGIAPPADGKLRVLSLNLHNYFNGDGRGGGFPTSRGAGSSQEFRRQRDRLAATIGQIKPQLVAVMELENDGFGPYSAAADFIADLERASGGSWLAVSLGGPGDPDAGIGEDEITVGLFYDQSTLGLKGRARTLDSEPFRERSRQPLAQAFVDLDSGQSFTVIVNHLKSKGSCPDSGRNADLRDGQGCWNEARTEAAREVARWARQLSDATSQGRVLVVGDMNAYRMEDPVSALIDSGLTDLTAPSGPRPSYSYFYGGQAGTLDYAFSSPGLLPFVAAARVININSPWPPNMDLPQPWLRSSDHDPVIVDLGFKRD